MKNTIEIKNFLTIDTASIDITKFTFFIGPQASGKSIVAKLLYIFFHLPEYVLDTAFSRGKRRKLNETIINVFSEVFPQYAWNEKNFNICFKTDKGKITFNHEGNKSLSLGFSEYYKKIIDNIFSFSSKEPSAKDLGRDNIDCYIKIETMIRSSDWGFITGAGSSVFIPAGRSFFACLENNVFSFLSNNIHIDYFLKEFGMMYQHSKTLLTRFSQDNSEKSNSFSSVCKRFIGGTYLQKQQKDYIKNTKAGLEIEARDASSGQQELLPVLFMLFRKQHGLILIEEPETHIFSSSQSEIIRYIVSTQIVNSCQKAFLFTTHSPYVLTTANNLAYAGILENKFKQQNNKSALAKLDKIYKANERIALSDLSAYYFNDGRIESIVDIGSGMINAQKLDEISEKTDEKFSDLLSLEATEK